MNNNALVLLSGGLDSSVCLAWAKQQFNSVSSITFDYNQRHSIELKAASKIASLMQVENTVLPINTFSKLGQNSLVDKSIKLAHSKKTELPNTFVPGRNVIFFTYACAFAYNNNINHIIGGMGQVDYSGYPDCRSKSIEAIEKALCLSMDHPFTLHTPLMFLSKKEIWELAYKLNVFSIIKKESHSCYNGVYQGCGECDACILRNNGLREFEMSWKKD